MTAVVMAGVITNEVESDSPRPICTAFKLMLCIKISTLSKAVVHYSATDAPVWIRWSRRRYGIRDSLSWLAGCELLSSLTSAAVLCPTLKLWVNR